MKPLSLGHAFSSKELF
jgi:predicted oxidoreductase